MQETLETTAELILI